MSFKVAILTASDRSARGEREDLSGKVIEEIVKEMGGRVFEKIVVSDDLQELQSALIRLADEVGVDLVLTTGGTGLAPRDLTPEATRAVIEKEVPGIAEAMRAAGLKKTPHAMLSRALCGVRGQTLIINLPGSPKAVKENLEAISAALPHALELLKGKVTDCAEGAGRGSKE
ncbi:MAG: molybdopterin adenylyltransferase [Dethiobacteria bacterium]|jgi:molybdopterin adenylyltransferase